MIHYAFLFDYDNCISSVSAEQTIINHQGLLNDLNNLTIKKDITKSVGLLSNRIDIHMDMFTAIEYGFYSIRPDHNFFECLTGSCYFAIEEIARHLNATHNKFLLNDIFHQLNIGDTWEKIIHTRAQPSFIPEEYYTAIHDKNKITGIYGQIHHLSLKYSESEIIVYYFDDQKKILSNSSAFFEQHHELIPKNVIIHFFRYDIKNKNPQIIQVISGSGDTDHHFKETIFNMTKIGLMDQDKINYLSSFINYADYANLYPDPKIKYEKAEQVDIQEYIKLSKASGEQYFSKYRNKTIEQFFIKNIGPIIHSETKKMIEIPYFREQIKVKKDLNFINSILKYSIIYHDIDLLKLCLDIRRITHHLDHADDIKDDIKNAIFMAINKQQRSTVELLFEYDQKLLQLSNSEGQTPEQLIKQKQNLLAVRIVPREDGWEELIPTPLKSSIFRVNSTSNNKQDDDDWIHEPKAEYGVK